MSSTRIYGRALWLTIDGEDKAADIKECTLEHDDGNTDQMTFGDAAAGVTAAKLSLTAIQSTATASFWRWCWENSGTEVPFKMAPHGNAVATADQPHISGTVTVGPRPLIGGKADPRTAYDFKTEWQAEVDPTLIVTGV